MTVQEFVYLAKEWLVDGKYKANREGEWPEIWSGYRDVIRQYERILIHSNSDHFPEKVFKDIIPESPDKAIDYLKTNYEPTTHPVFGDFVNTVLRGVNNSTTNYEQVREEFWTYLDKEIPNYKNLDSFFSAIETDLTLIDPMGVITVRPEMIPTTEIEGQTVIEGDINPTLFYYECWRIIDFQPGVRCLILVNENTNLDAGNKGYVFHEYTPNEIIIYRQTGKFLDWTFSEEVFFPHNLGQMPAFRLGGSPIVVDNKIHYVSSFYRAVAPLNEAMKDNAFLAVFKRRSAFATLVRVASACEYMDEKSYRCINGWLDTVSEDGERKKRKCPSCEGTGITSGASPFKDFTVPASNKNVPTGYKAGDMMQYVSPPVETANLLRTEIEGHLRQARAVLHIEHSNSFTDVKTATQSGIDLKSTVAFVLPIVQVIINVKQRVADVMVKMKFGNEATAPIYTAPKNIDLKTASDYLEDLKLAEEAGLPPIVKSMILRDYLVQTFVTSDAAEKVLDAVMHSDRFFERSPAEMALVTNAEPWERVLHDSAYSIAVMVVNEVMNFYELPIPQQVALLQQKAKDITPTPIGVTAVDDILNG